MADSLDTGLACLPEDCWLHIFRHLNAPDTPLATLIRCVLISKFWSLFAPKHILPQFIFAGTPVVVTEADETNQEYSLALWSNPKMSRFQLDQIRFASSRYPNTSSFSAKYISGPFTVVNQFRQLTTLSLDSCGLFDDDIALLCHFVLDPPNSATSVPKLARLCLQNNFICTNAARYLATAISTQHLPLTCVDLSSNWINDAGCYLLFEALKANVTSCQWPEEAPPAIKLLLLNNAVSGHLEQHYLKDLKNEHVQVELSYPKVDTFFALDTANPAEYTGCFIYNFAQVIFNPRATKSRVGKLTGMLLELYTGNQTLTVATEDGCELRNRLMEAQEVLQEASRQ